MYRTRLAQEAARLVVDASLDGVAFVGLVPVAGRALVPSAIGQALGVREAGDGRLTVRPGALRPAGRSS